MLALSAMASIADSVSHKLACHPQTPSRSIRGIDVVVDGAANGILTVTFALQGDLSALRIPESRPSRWADKLWQHACFEVFVMAGEGPGYREFNFSPSGEWAVYAFRGYRVGMGLVVEQGPDISVQRSGKRLDLEAQIPPELLPQGRSPRLGLSAVVEAADGGLSYWALRHPPGRPDFHHMDAFALQLELPECVT